MHVAFASACTLNISPVNLTWSYQNTTQWCLCTAAFGMDTPVDISKSLRRDLIFGWKKSVKIRSETDPMKRPCWVKGGGFLSFGSAR